LLTFLTRNVAIKNLLFLNFSSYIVLPDIILLNVILPSVVVLKYICMCLSQNVILMSIILMNAFSLEFSLSFCSVPLGLMAICAMGKCQSVRSYGYSDCCCSASILLLNVILPNAYLLNETCTRKIQRSLKSGLVSKAVMY